MKPTSMPVATPIRVLLIGDHAIVRVGLRLLIESQPGLVVVGETESNHNGISVAGREQPDIILVDLITGSQSELENLPRLLTAARDARLLVLTGVPDAKVHRRAVQLGAMGVVLKGKPPEILIKAIEKVHTGEVWLDRVTTANVLSELSRPGRQERDDFEVAQIKMLTKRERDIITLVAQGLKNRQIAERLSISDITVRHHLTSIFSKLAVADRFELIIYAYRQGLCAPPASQQGS